MPACDLRNVSRPPWASVFLFGKSSKAVWSIRGVLVHVEPWLPADVQYMVTSENSFSASHKEVGKAKCSENLSLTTRINAIPTQAFTVLCQEYLLNTYHVLLTQLRAEDPEVGETRGKNRNHFNQILKRHLQRRECPR